MEQLLEIFRSLDWSVPAKMIGNIIPALICITLHELSHGFAAYLLGDDTAKRMGRLTLNPIKHIDIFGLLMMIVFRFGWAKPVPVDMRRFKNPKRGMAITALAGPVSNAIICCVMLFVYGLVFYPLVKLDNAATDYILNLIVSTAYLSLALGLFNLIPLPPLDGSKILFSFLSNGSYYKLMRYERYGMIILFAIMATDALGSKLTYVTEFIFDKLFLIAEFSFNIITRIIN